MIKKINSKIVDVNYFYKLIIFLRQQLTKYRPYVLLFALILLMFCINHENQSLIAHDEGLYARRARLIVDSNNWFTPFNFAHHKTVGGYWLIALSLKLFGNTDFAARLPTIISSFSCLFLIYLLAIELLDRNIGIIAISLLISTPIWIQYSRYASPDMPYLFLNLLSVYFLIKAINSRLKKHRLYLLFGSGLCFSIAFFIRSYMVLVPIIVLLPFAIFYLRRQGIQSIVVFLSGSLIGLIPTIISLYFAYQSYGDIAITSLFTFARQQAFGNHNLVELLYSSLRLVILSYPFSIFLIILIALNTNKIESKLRFILFIYPTTILLILLTMSTSYPHYYLIIFPPFALLLGNYLYRSKLSIKSAFIKPTLIAILSIINLFLTTLIIFLYKYDFAFLQMDNTNILLLISPLFVSNFFAIKYLIFEKLSLKLIRQASLIISLPQLVVLSIFYNMGYMGNPNKAVKKFITDSNISSIISNNNVYIYNVSSKVQTLLMFYLPTASLLNSTSSLTEGTYLVTSDPFFKSETLTNENSQVELIYTFDKNYFFQIK